MVYYGSNLNIDRVLTVWFYVFATYLRKIPRDKKTFLQSMTMCRQVYTNFKAWVLFFFFFFFCDFNSRCGDLKDYIEGVDAIGNREVIDFQVNSYGHILLDFLINSNFCIFVCGRNSNKNDFTSVSTKGSSVVDYCLVSHAVLDKFSDFYVYTASELINLNGNINVVVPSSIPDHSCITWVISTETGASGWRK